MTDFSLQKLIFYLIAQTPFFHFPQIFFWFICVDNLSRNNIVRIYWAMTSKPCFLELNFWHQKLFQKWNYNPLSFNSWLLHNSLTVIHYYQANKMFKVEGHSRHFFIQLHNVNFIQGLPVLWKISFTIKELIYQGLDSRRQSLGILLFKMMPWLLYDSCEEKLQRLGLMQFSSQDRRVEKDMTEQWMRAWMARSETKKTEISFPLSLK